MKHIITTVGTSVFTNFFKDEVKKAYENNSNVLVGYDNILTAKHLEPHENKTAKQYDNCFEPIENRLKINWLIGTKRRANDKKKWEKWQNDVNIRNLDASAEIKSICKIIEESTDTEFKVYLICSDTAICISAGYLVKAFFEGYTINGVTFPKPELRNSKGQEIKKIEFSKHSPSEIKNLKIDNANTFIGESIFELLQKLEYVRANTKDILLNISGGYKALIPIISIYAQIRKCDIKYIYEDSNELITITPFPLSIDNNTYFSSGLLIREDFLQILKTELDKPDSAQKAVFKKLLQRFRDEKLIDKIKIDRTTLGEILRSLSPTDIENDFGDDIIEPALKVFFDSQEVYSEYHTPEINVCIGSTTVTNKGTKKCEGRRLKIEGCDKDVNISEIDIEMFKQFETELQTKVIGEIKALGKNNEYWDKANTCEDYFYKMKGRIIKHNDFEGFKDKPIEFLYIVYAFQFDVSRNSFKGNLSVEHFRKRFAEDEELKTLNVSFRALGLTLPIENPLAFNYEEWKKDWTKYLYNKNNWEEI